MPNMPNNRDWDIVDQAGLESFPASDPPSWGSHHAAPSADTVALPDSEMVGRLHHRAKIALCVLAGGVLLVGLIALGAKLRGSA
jgi:hypothetical protein